MPQASEYITEWWGASAKRLGLIAQDVEPDVHALTNAADELLRVRGFVTTRLFSFQREVEPDEDERNAIAYMIEEWDYGGWVRDGEADE